MAPRQQGEGRHVKCRWCDCHLRLRDQAASVTVHMGQSGKRKANSCYCSSSSSSSCPGHCAFYIMQEEVVVVVRGQGGGSHAYLQEKEEEENNPPPRPLP